MDDKERIDKYYREISIIDYLESEIWYYKNCKNERFILEFLEETLLNFKKSIWNMKNH